MMAVVGELFFIYCLHYAGKATAGEFGGNAITTFHFPGITDDRGGICFLHYCVTTLEGC